MAWDPLDDCSGFDWDDANIDKNWHSHAVAWWECEEVFFNRPRTILRDIGHSDDEHRFLILGQSNAGRWLMICFTIRQDLIRPISARDMNARERKTYALHSKKNPDLQ